MEPAEQPAGAGGKDAFGSYRHTMRLVAMACLAIAFSVSLMGWLGYLITQRAVVARLKSQDLPYIISSVAEQVDGRVARAKETSLLLAHNPTIVHWLEQGESDQQLGQLALAQIIDVKQRFDYQNAFIVSGLTGHYWAEDGRLLDTVLADDPDDSWFFQAMSAGQPTSIDIDYNNERGDTFVFINALIGDPAHPLGVAGVGLSLQDIADLFASYQFGSDSSLWLIDNQGSIQLSEDLEHRGLELYEVLGANLASEVLSDLSTEERIRTYRNQQGQTFDLIHQQVPSTDWQLVLQISRSQSIALLGGIRINSLLVGVFCLLMMAGVFYLVSARVSNPYRQVLLINQELEKQVGERTAELQRQHTEIVDSITYARRLQEAVIPSEQQLALACSDHLLIWRPRDIVGGDFYWLRRRDHGFVLVVADCTGHGVPGALMTVLVTSLLDRIVDEHGDQGPATILERLHTSLREALHSHKTDLITDDGLDAGVCCVDDSGQVSFAGARINLYLQTPEGVEMVPGDRQSVGYHYDDESVTFHQTDQPLDPATVYYLTTDGLLDQNGGPKNYALGRNQFMAWLTKYNGRSLAEQRCQLQGALSDYMHGQEQRDDILVVAFRI